jgi:hypothetical protein
LIVTDLSPDVAQASWYGLRNWIEQGYKRVKGGGWNLPHTRITTRARLERVWLAVAVATMWVLEVGGEAEDADPPRSGKRVGEDTPALPDLSPDPTGKTAEAEETSDRLPKRTWSTVTRGWNVLRNALAVGVLVLGTWLPEPWPDHPVPGLPPTPAVASAGQEGAPARPPPAVTDSNGGSHVNDHS